MDPQPQYPAQNQWGEVSLGEWMLTIFLSSIPLVGFIMLFVWGFGSNTNPNKANWAKAMLLWIAIVIGIYLIFFVIIFGLMIGGSIG